MWWGICHQLQFRFIFVYKEEETNVVNNCIAKSEKEFSFFMSYSERDVKMCYFFKSYSEIDGWMNMEEYFLR